MLRFYIIPLIILYALSSAAQRGEPSFSYEKFKNAEGLMLSSDAKVKKNTVYLTPPEEEKRGGVWYVDSKMFVSDTFEAIFCFRIHGHSEVEGPSGRGGEGLAFVIHNNAIPGKNGEKREGMGYEGIPNSLAIEFDTQDTEDMGGQHVSVQTEGFLPNHHGKPSSYASDTLEQNIKDGEYHTANIKYNNPNLTVLLDGEEVLSCEMDITEFLNLDGGGAWVGITSATGETYSIHEIACFHMKTKERDIPYLSNVDNKERTPRKIKRNKRIVVHSKHIRIRLWDINQEDGDIVSVNLNGRWVVDHYQLSNQGKYFDFDLDGQVNYLILHAHNLGETPPNTAGISVSDGAGGEKEYTLRSNLYASDALLIEYHKKDKKDIDITRQSGEGERKDLKMDTRSDVFDEEGNELKRD